LLDAVFAGKAKQALALYREQRALRVEPQAIIAMLAWQLGILLTVKAAGNRSVTDIAREAKLNPFVVRKAQSSVRHLTLVQLKGFVSGLLAIDVALKQRSIDADDALQLYLIKLAGA